jgi:hypothetical protein
VGGGRVSYPECLSSAPLLHLFFSSIGLLTGMTGIPLHMAMASDYIWSIFFFRRKLQVQVNEFKSNTEEKRRLYNDLLAKDKKGVGEIAENNKKITKLMESGTFFLIVFYPLFSFFPLFPLFFIFSSFFYGKNKSCILLGIRKWAFKGYLNETRILCRMMSHD